jgi:excisionase family DNA binding protein
MKNRLMIEDASQNIQPLKDCSGTQAEELLTMEEAAPIFKLSLQGAYRAAREKQIPAIRIGRLYRVPKSAIQSWIAGQLQNTGAQKAAA